MSNLLSSKCNQNGISRKIRTIKFDLSSTPSEGDGSGSRFWSRLKFNSKFWEGWHSMAQYYTWPEIYSNERSIDKTTKIFNNFVNRQFRSNSLGRQRLFFSDYSQYFVFFSWNMLYFEKYHLTKNISHKISYKTGLHAFFYKTHNEEGMKV